MNRQQLSMILCAALLFITWCSCNKKEEAVSPPLPGNEALTTMILKAVNVNDPTDTPSAKWVQLDPNGVTPPDTSLAVLKLKKNASYTVQVTLLDTLADVTPEIKDRENYHLFCFDIAPGLGLAVSRTDHDTNNPPLEIGITDLFTTAAVSSGMLEVTLHHQPNVKNGQCAPGSIDMDCIFTVNVTN